jgi:hypothetical protein
MTFMDEMESPTDTELAAVVFPLAHIRKTGPPFRDIRPPPLSLTQTRLFRHANMAIAGQSAGNVAGLG